MISVFTVRMNLLLRIFRLFFGIFLLLSAHPPMIRIPKGIFRFNVEARAAKR